jgi:hypothetical protein
MRRVVERSLSDYSQCRTGTSLLRVLQFIAGKGVSTLDHLLYSPDLAIGEFWLFPKFKRVLKRKVFEGHSFLGF